MNETDKSAFGFDDPNRSPLDRATNAIDRHDDPNRGPIDRAANAVSGHDDANRGPLDRAANAVTGGTGGVSAALGGTTDAHRDAGSTSYAGSTGTTGSSDAGVISAIFDSNAEAERAVAELRQHGINDADLSLIAQSKSAMSSTMTTREGGGEVIDEEHTNILRGILGGGALGAGLGVAALAIPGVGPLAAIGAIAAAAVPEAVAIGAVAGAVGGTFNETLKKHGVSDDDAKYYGGHLKDGGVLVTVHAGNGDRQKVQDVLYRNGGHSSSQARTAAI